MLFDVHAHYDDEKFDGDRDELLSKMPEGGVGHIINAGCDIESSLRSLELAKKYPFIYASVGFHPSEADKMKDSDFDVLEKLASEKKAVAIGEIGLEYHYSKETAEIQKKRFFEQIELAKAVGLPFQVHDRDADGDCLKILKSVKMGDRRGMMHCFSGSKETAREILKLGMKISVGGTLTFKNNVRGVEVVSYVPIEDIMIETDCPYLAPEPHRGKRNSSLYIIEAAKKIAEIKGMDVEEVIDVTEKTAMEFYGISD